MTSSAAASAASSPDSRRRAQPPAIGVVGVGALGRHHARVVRDLEGVSHAGVFDVERPRCRAVAAELGVEEQASLTELLEAADAVVIAVPTSGHEAVAMDAIRAGVHVFVEKPMAASLEAADRMIEAAADRDVLIQVGHVERFNPVLAAARPHLDRPLFVESHRLSPFTRRSLDVAVVLDLMIHDVDLLCSLIGSPVVRMAATGVPVLTRHVDIANARLEFEGGAVANLTASRVSVTGVRKLRVWQRSGYLSLDLAGGRGEFFRLREGVSLLEGSGLAGHVSSSAGDVSAAAGDVSVPAGLSSIVERIPIAGDGTEPLMAELASFRDALLGLAPPPVTGEDGRTALRLALAIQQQIEDHVANTRAASS
ncbi:MAG: Gfo/Idh/MocA family oxidoreductase [Gemmatimonadetes bacterium]|nr:Gfo/Idh/MocA family oxidoreductase [Gemmatimonadota bacterium]